MSKHKRPQLLAIGAVPLLSAALLVVGASSVSADGPTGSAFGYYALNITIFGGAQKPTGPTPTASLSPGPQSATAPTGVVAYGPATLFTSDAISVQTSGSATSVTSKGDVKDINKATTQPNTGSEELTAGEISSTCSAAGSGNTGSTTVTNGTVATAADSNGTPTSTQPVPTNPAPNTAISGTVSTGDAFRDVFNEQSTSGGVLTVNAVHEYFLGPTLKGDLIIGQVACGLTAAASSGAPGASSGSSGSSGTSGSSGSVGTPATGSAAPWLIAAPLAALGAGLLAGAGFIRRRARGTAKRS